MIDLLFVLVAIASLIGTVANAFHRRWCFLIWACSNVAWVCYDLHKGAWTQAGLVAIYAVLAGVGWVQWGREEQGHSDLLDSWLTHEEKLRKGGDALARELTLTRRLFPAHGPGARGIDAVLREWEAL